ncbi:polymorphic toxin-type HINT domain-containing protein [Promicromonospora sp. NPDC057488]|uniref:polymorphic toxin-type HINT domain-containing protein n=1 Tax=Promicromonospora sp. NPDC057488 TaxID=3346147 RepID=UPI0036719A5E
MAAVRWWRKWWVWLIAGGVVLLGFAVAGIVTLVSTFLGFAEDAAAEEEARQPFELALDELAQTAAVHQRGTSAGVDYDLRVTSDGDALGSFSVDGDEYRVLKIGDQEYVKPPSGTLAAEGATREMRRELDKRWLVNEGDAVLPVGDLFQTPQEYAEYLRSAVRAGELPSSDAAVEEVEVDGVPARWVQTSVGPVYVTQEPPYEVLRVDAPADSSDSSDSADSSDTSDTSGSSGAEQGDVADDVLEAPVPAEGPSAVTQMSQDEVADLFDEMIGLTKQLKTAVNPSITFDMGGQAQVSCAAGGCTSSVEVTTDVATSQGTVTGGSVTGELVSVFQVQGGAAGTCRSSSALPLQGTTSMGCSSPSAGGVFAAAEAREGAKAQAQADACGCSVPYEVPYAVDAQVVARAEVRVEVLRSELGDRRKKLMDKGSFCSFAGSTPVLMGDGTREPIQDIEVGDEVWAADPVSGERGPREVTHVWVHQDELFELEIDGETILTTEDHPFWSATDQRFERADELGAGELVLGADGERLAVGEGVDLASSRMGSAYNLSVAGLHTYHVGSDAVLVHNTAGCPPRFIDAGGMTIDRRSIGSKISDQKQARHIDGPDYRHGGYFTSKADAQRVLNEFHDGSAKVLGVTDRGYIVVKSPHVSGVNHNVGAGHENQPTDVFFIKGTRAVSIVPANPNWKP